MKATAAAGVIESRDKARRRTISRFGKIYPNRVGVPNIKRYWKITDRDGMIDTLWIKSR